MTLLLIENFTSFKIDKLMHPIKVIMFSLYQINLKVNALSCMKISNGLALQNLDISRICTFNC